MRPPTHVSRPHTAGYGILAARRRERAVNATVRIGVTWAFGLMEADFTGSLTRWRFDPESANA
jgi:hypothetical protein